MKRILFALFLGIAFAAPAGRALAAQDVWGVDPSHSDVQFRVRHLVSKVTGDFTKFEGEIRFEGKDYAKGSVGFEIETASINTANEKRDEHLKSADFFDAATNPKITFKSSKVTVKGPEDLIVSGDLTMRGVTKPIDLAVKILGFGADPWGNERAGFEVSGKLDRKDFGILWNKELDKGGTLLGDDVELVIALEAVKQEPEAAGEAK